MNPAKLKTLCINCNNARPARPAQYKRTLNNKISILRLYSADFRYFCGPKTESVLGNHLELARNFRKESPASP